MPPVGLTLFSVGAGGAALGVVVVVVVVVVEVDGVSLALLPHAVASVPAAMSREPTARTVRVWRIVMSSCPVRVSCGGGRRAVRWAPEAR